MKTDKTLELYIHVPFCARKCDYCDFISFVKGADIQDRYFDMLVKEIKEKSEFTGNLPVDSVFFGGGTPSLVDEKNIEKVLVAIKECYELKDQAEITIEMNPNSANLEKLVAYKRAGINRLSIGLQSTVDEELKLLSRLHTYEEFLDSYNMAREAGFENINIDLMSAIPGQTLKSYEESLKRVLSLKPQHISAYSLILEEETPFYERYKNGDSLPDEDTERKMYYLTKRILKEAGYERYEISNYSKPGFECRHNIGYWVRKPYIGFGLAAASLFNNKRYSKHTDLNKYLEGDFCEEVTNLSLEDQMDEFMFLGLRMINGVSKKDFEETFGRKVEDEYADALNKLTKEELLINTDRIYLTDKGLDVANYCMAYFLH